MSNQLLIGKILVLNGKNNHKYINKQAIKGGYTYNYRNFEIVLSKKVKNNIFDHPKLQNIWAV